MLAVRHKVASFFAHNSRGDRIGSSREIGAFSCTDPNLCSQSQREKPLFLNLGWFFSKTAYRIVAELCAVAQYARHERARKKRSKNIPFTEKINFCELLGTPKNALTGNLPIGSLFKLCAKAAHYATVRFFTEKSSEKNSVLKENQLFMRKCFTMPQSIISEKKN